MEIVSRLCYEMTGNELTGGKQIFCIAPFDLELWTVPAKETVSIYKIKHLMSSLI